MTLNPRYTEETNICPVPAEPGKSLQLAGPLQSRCGEDVWRTNTGGVFKGILGGGGDGGGGGGGLRGSGIGGGWREREREGEGGKRWSEPL